MAKRQNIVGPQVRQLRYERGLKQEDLAARCGVLGWDLSRGTLSKIEAQLRCVTDAELETLRRRSGLKSRPCIPPGRGAEEVSLRYPFRAPLP